ncbi:MAG: DUF3080 family protein [Halioglobus sp.]
MNLTFKHCTTLFLMFGLLTLNGCGEPTADTPFETYLDRLGRTLDVGTKSVVLYQPIPRQPRPGQLRLDIPSDKLGTLDFMDLRGCELQVTIGKRNSSLGRLARDSQKLLLALEYLALAPACVEYLQAEGETELARKLEQAQRQKSDLLPALIFNATLAGEEFQALWRPTPLTGNYPTDTSSAVVTALENIHTSVGRWLAGDYSANNLTFELQLSEVSRGDAGQLWRALAHQGQWLDAANAKLKRRGPICKDNLRPESADILPNVIRKYFIDGIQPRAAMLGRRYHQLTPPIFALEALLRPDLPPDYLSWSEGRNSALGKLTQAPKQHVLQLQQALDGCHGNP